MTEDSAYGAIGAPHPSPEEIAESLVGVGADPRAVTTHVGTCPQCASVADSLRSIDRQIAALPSVAMPDDVWLRTLDRLEVRPAGRRYPRWLPTAAAVAASVIGFGLLFGAVEYGHDDADAPALTADGSADGGSPGPTSAVAPPLARVPSSGSESTPTLSVFPDPTAACLEMTGRPSEAWAVRSADSGGGTVEGPDGLTVTFSADLTRASLTVPAPMELSAAAVASTDGLMLVPAPTSHLDAGGAAITEVLVCIEP